MTSEGTNATREASSRALVPYADFPWSETLQALQHRIPTALISPEKSQELCDFAETIPGLWNWGMLECRLAEEDTTVDLLGCTMKRTGSEESLRETISRGLPARSPLTSPALARWSEPGTKGLATSDTFWMEWDQPKHESKPLSWICLAPEYFGLGTGRMETRGFQQLVESYFDADPCHWVQGANETLLRLRSELPEGGQITAFASLGPRGGNTCRAFIRLPRGTLLQWLDRISWPGDRKEAHDAFKVFDVAGEDTWLQLEFDTNLRPHLGLELAQTERGFLNRSSRQRWLEHAVSQGWASEQKAGAVLKWPGTSEIELAHESQLTLQRNFHLKLKLTENQEPVAKAYLGFYCRRQGA